MVEAPPHFLAVGRFVGKKAPHLTISAFGEMYLVEPAATLTMVGDGPLLEQARAHATSLGLQDAISFPGVLTPEEIVALMGNARAFVQHSVTAPDGDREGSPVALLEAQMAGLPVVSTRHSGIPEIVADGETGILVEERDAAGMGRAMARLAREPMLAGTLGKAGRERALAHFSQARTLAAPRLRFSGTALTASALLISIFCGPSTPPSSSVTPTYTALSPAGKKMRVAPPWFDASIDPGIG